MDKILKTLKIDKELDDLIEDYCKLTKNIFGNKPTFTHIVTSGIESYLLEKISDLKILHSGNAAIFSESGERIKLNISKSDFTISASFFTAVL